MHEQNRFSIWLNIQVPVDINLLICGSFDMLLYFIVPTYHVIKEETIDGFIIPLQVMKIIYSLMELF